MADITIVGAGPVGASLALTLAKTTSLRITLLEAQSVQQHSAKKDKRTVALSYGSRNIFASLGIWDKFSEIAMAIEHIHISNQGHFGFTRIHASDYNLPALGYVLSYQQLTQVLWHQLAEQKHIQWLSPAKVTDVTVAKDKVSVSVSTENDMEKQIHTKWLIAADGGSSYIRQLLACSTAVKDYHQSALVGIVKVRVKDANIAYERFTPKGPLALLPVAPDSYGFIWTMNHTDAKAMMTSDESDLCSILQDEFGYRLGHFLALEKHGCFPLQCIKSKEQIHGRVILLGNAAHTLHPIAGQGFNLSLRDAALLAECFQEASHEYGHNNNNSANLNGFIDNDNSNPECNSYVDELSKNISDRYLIPRRADQSFMLAFTDGLVRLFTNEHWPLIMPRNTALLLLDIISPLKRSLVRRTSGLVTPMSRLSQGESV